MKTLLLTDPLPAAAFADAIAALAPELNLLSYRADIGNAELADVDVVLGWRLPPGVAPTIAEVEVGLLGGRRGGKVAAPRLAGPRCSVAHRR